MPAPVSATVWVLAHTSLTQEEARYRREIVGREVKSARTDTCSAVLRARYRREDIRKDDQLMKDGRSEFLETQQCKRQVDGFNW